MKDKPNQRRITIRAELLTEQGDENNLAKVRRNELCDWLVETFGPTTQLKRVGLKVEGRTSGGLHEMNGTVVSDSDYCDPSDVL